LKLYRNICALIDTVTVISEFQYVHLMTYAMYSVYVWVFSLDQYYTYSQNVFSLHVSLRIERKHTM